MKDARTLAEKYGVDFDYLCNELIIADSNKDAMALEANEVQFLLELLEDLS